MHSFLADSLCSRTFSREFDDLISQSAQTRLELPRISLLLVPWDGPVLEAWQMASIFLSPSFFSFFSIPFFIRFFLLPWIAQGLRLWGQWNPSRYDPYVLKLGGLSIEEGEIAEPSEIVRPQPSRTEWLSIGDGHVQQYLQAFYQSNV